jgi:hypothetical protein
MVRSVSARIRNATRKSVADIGGGVTSVKLLGWRALKRTAAMAGLSKTHCPDQ